MKSHSGRTQIFQRLVEDLVGPLEPNEVISDRPTQRYSTGILYPLDSRIGPEENVDGGAAVNIGEDAASLPEEIGVSLHAALKPSSAGLSFALESASGNKVAEIQCDVKCAVYQQIFVDENGNETSDNARQKRGFERWRRHPLIACKKLSLSAGDSKFDLTEEGIPGLELYILVTPHAGLATVTTALSNRRHRGETSAFDEAQHFFQVELRVSKSANGEFAPRPSQRVQTDEDSRIAALIYRDVKEYVVGHTCSARAVFSDTRVIALVTDWIPSTLVPGVSDSGDQVFEGIRKHSTLHPLEARWLSTAKEEQMLAGLGLVATAYENWIASEERRISEIPIGLRPQAVKHIGRCRDGNARILAGIKCLGKDRTVLRAFQLAQEAMHTQFSWQRSGKMLIWRPFQLAFQLLALASLADRDHTDRETMDLLWFPTGGGKTEAYLGLAAFVIILRRLRASTVDDGSGVAVLMRYTLRLLTVQQFQRASAMICACELIRRRLGASEMGKSPVGIGLWVGAAATPSTLKDAINRKPGDTSTAEQLTACPCCAAKLSWKINSRESEVECSSQASKCEFAATGSRLPVWTIDEEIYRHTPSLLIGTVDKFAQVVRKVETGVLFGHGTKHYPPDLIVQDELHLISGPLGSIAGLYEVAVDELCRRDNQRPKVIGSTATIRRAEEQVRHLFDRTTYQFPAPGLDSGNSGFAVTDFEQPGRLFVGVTTAGRSATYMLQATTAEILQSASAPGIPDAQRDYYWTLVAYFNSLRELGRALVLMQDDVPISIAQFAARRLEQRRKIEPPAELTSRVRSYEIRDRLSQLSKTFGDPEAVDLLVASNMISVGMDIPRLGIMIVNAQPKTMSEYIQATSRVGRGDVPGIVVTMYNSMRARDRSHFETFETWHRSLYRDVEATSVTPFASRAQDKALHAVLVALVRHMVPGMRTTPVLGGSDRLEVDKIGSVIEQRVARIDSPECPIVARKLKALIDQWESRKDLQTYWDDYDKKISLLMSAEQYAAKADSENGLDPERARRALWPTPNSMREVEAGTPFVLRYVLRKEPNK